MAETRKHIAEIELEADPETVFAILITPSDICNWWQSDRAIVIPKNDGLWVASWGNNQDEPDYVSAGRIKVFDPPKRLCLHEQCYLAKSGGPPFDAKMTTSFEVEPTATGCTLRVIQDGFPIDPIADEFYADCEQGWHDTLSSFKRCVAERRAADK